MRPAGTSVRNIRTMHHRGAVPEVTRRLLFFGAEGADLPTHSCRVSRLRRATLVH